MECSSCGLEKELTRHGTCFKCHIGGIQTKKSKCKGCGKNPEAYRVSGGVTSSSTHPFKG